MEIDRKELKRRSREAMGLTQPRFWLVTLTYLVLTYGVSDLLTLLPFSSGSAPGFHTSAIFLTIFLALYKIIVDFGFTLWSLWTSRKLNPGLGALVQGFSVAGRIILMELLILARVMLWALAISFLVVIPLVLLDSPTLLSLFMVVVIGLVYVTIWVLMLRYALAPFLLADRPDDGARVAVRRSAELMRGWKGQLFRLELSFLGWVLVSLLISGLALLLSLWHAGVLQALGAFSLEELPELIAGYSVWRSGVPLELFPLRPEEISLYTQYAAASGSVWTSLLATLMALPLSLWLTPYRGVARAGFYDARLQLQQEATASLPL